MGAGPASAAVEVAVQFELLGYRLRVRGPAEEVEPLKSSFYSRCQVPAEGEVDAEFRVVAGPKRFLAYEAKSEDEPVFSGRDRADFFWWLDEYFFNYALWNGEHLLQIHGGAVAREGEAILFIGGSHTGKSSLCARLLRRGYAFFTDETILVEPDTLRVRSFPRNLMVRRGAAWGDPGLAALCAERWFFQSERENPRWFLDPAVFGSPGGEMEAEVGRIILLAQKPEGPPVFERVGARAVVGAMLEQELNFENLGERALDAIIRLANRGANYRLSAAHPGEAWLLLAERLGFSPGGNGR